MIAGVEQAGFAAAPGVIALRPATALDAARVLAWNNAADVRARSIDPRPITSEAHARWFAARLGDPRGHFWIVLLDRVPVGVLRVDRRGERGAGRRGDGDAGRISIVLDPSARGHGLGRRAIALACAADGGPIVAEILADNLASRAAFAAAGFIPEPAPRRAPADDDPSSAPAARPLVRYLWRPRDPVR